MNKALQLLKNFKFTSLNEGCKKLGIGILKIFKKCTLYHLEIIRGIKNNYNKKTCPS